ncbi:MAG: hypothetical protein IT384_29525 [Deltaproteobacteria bacterium]|nr:hypothetical protein [Deltaproteobacteria bacterium]
MGTWVHRWRAGVIACVGPSVVARVGPSVVACVLAAPIACTPRDWVYTALPEVPGARSVVLGAGDEESLEIFADDLPLPEPTRLPFELDEGRRRLQAVFFDAPLEAQGMEQGVQRTREDGVPLSRATASYATSLDGTWTVTATPSRALKEARIAERPSPCVTFSGSAVNTPVAGTWFTFGAVLETGVVQENGAVLEAGAVLLGTSQNELLEVRRAEQRLLAVPAGVVPTALRRVADGRLFAGTTGGDLVELTVTGTTISAAWMTRVPFAEEIHALDGDVEGDRLELFALTSPGTFLRLEGDAWVPIARLPMSPAVMPGKLVYVGQRTALAATRAAPGVTRYRDGVIDALVPVGLESPVVAMAQVPGLGMVMADERGVLVALKADDRFEVLGKSGLDLELDVIHPFRAGLLAGGFNGYVAQYHPSAGFCPIAQLGSHSVLVILPLDGGFVLAGKRPVSAQYTAVTFLAPQGAER